MKRIQFYVILFLISSLIACKKEEANNPDIDDVILNYSAENKNITEEGTFFDLNIDNEGFWDFRFFISNPNDDPNQHSISLSVIDAKYQFLIYTPDDAFSIKKIEKGVIINQSSSIWRGGDNILMYHYFISGDNIYNYGFSDIGEQYIAFRKKNSGGGYFYGWMLVNIEHGEKITIKEYALHKIADTPIMAGEK